MKFVKDKEEGFLLLESLITLVMLASIMLLLYPIIVDWMTIRQDAKDKVDINRIFYEYSMDWHPTHPFNESNNSYSVQSKEHLLRVKKDKQDIVVTIYEYKFK